MKQKKSMLILVGILVALAILYIGLRFWNQKNSREEEEKIAVTEEVKLSGLSYTDGTDTMAFKKEDGIWYYEADKEIPMNQTTVEDIVSKVENLSAVRELDNPDDLADYGLEEPAYTIRYTTEDEEESILYIGNTTGENYYVTINDTKKVYTITSDLVTSLQFDLSGLVENDSVPSIGSGNLKKVEVTEDGMTDTYEEEGELGELAGGFGTLSLTECVDYHVTEEKLLQYGLDEENRITAVATYQDSSTEKEETFTIYIGNVEESGTYRYIMAKDSKMVYQVNKDIVKNMITVEEK